MNYIAVFVHWGNENQFPAEMAAEARSHNQTLVIFWEAKDYNNDNLDDAHYSYQAILRGDWDTYIKSFGDSIRSSGQPVILIPFEEVNGDWSPWSITHNGNSASQHKQTYQKIANMLHDIPNLKLGWTANNDSVPDTPDNSISNLYPGNAYVDIVGVDGFNFDDPWQTPSDVFDTSVATVSTFGKPVILFSLASAEGPQKAAWIGQLSAYLTSHPAIKGFVWFNENKEKNWLVWSDTNSLSAFQTLIHSLN
jgi:beta-mannanase